MSCNSMIASASPLPGSFYDDYDNYGSSSDCGCNQQVAIQPAYAEYEEPQQLAYQPAYVEQQQQLAVQPPVYNGFVQDEPVYEQLGTPGYALEAPLEQVYDEGLIANNYVEQSVLQQQAQLVYQQPQQQVVYQQQQPQQQVFYQQQQPQQQVVYQEQQPAVYQQQQTQAPAVYQQPQAQLVYQKQTPAVIYQEQPQQQQVAYYQQPARQYAANDCGCNRASPVQYVQRQAQPSPTVYNKTVVTNLNRHHLHVIRNVENTNNYNKYVTNHVTKVNDIHHYRVENVKGETRTFNDYRETQTVEPARCINGNCGRN